MTKRQKQNHRPVEPSGVPNLARRLTVLLVLDIVTLLLGIAFFVMVASIQLIVRSSAAYWSPAHRVMDFLLGSTARTPFVPGLVRGRAAVRLVIILAFAVLMILFGLFMLLSSGWCAQNLFCAAYL